MLFFDADEWERGEDERVQETLPDTISFWGRVEDAGTILLGVEVPVGTVGVIAYGMATYRSLPLGGAR
jgi:hypothetical protein